MTKIQSAKTLKIVGFTLVEIMIVVALIGLLAAIAIPNFIEARVTSQKSACIAVRYQPGYPGGHTADKADTKPSCTLSTAGHTL